MGKSGQTLANAYSDPHTHSKPDSFAVAGKQPAGNPERIALRKFPAFCIGHAVPVGYAHSLSEATRSAGKPHPIC